MKIDYSGLLDDLWQQPRLRDWAKHLPEQIASGLCERRYGDLPQWYQALEQLPKVTSDHLKLGHPLCIGRGNELSPEQRDELKRTLLSLAPWRKGPITLFDIEVNTEWRSNLKWQRLAPHITPLAGRQVLDVGCGNGYYAWRMLGQGARRVIGIDPSPRFVVQFYACKHFTTNVAVDVLPLGIEALPSHLAAFDSCFSMGVLYHRRSPMDHLRELRACLRPGGELILETLVIDGELGQCLVPEGRYAMMNNVWFIPSPETLTAWLRKCGYTDVRCVSVEQTTPEEQRTTPWMKFQSLQDFLHPQDQGKTAEGHPAPKRGIFIAKRPS